MASGLTGWSGTWKKHNWKISEKDMWGRGMWIDFSEWEKNHENICVPCECSQGVTSAEKDVNNQVDRMTHSVDTSQPLTIATSVFTQWAYDKVAMVAEMDIMHGLSNTDFHSPRLTWQWLPLNAETNTEPLIRHHSSGRSNSSVLEGCFHWAASIMEGAAFCPYCNRHLTWIWIYFPCM